MEKELYQYYEGKGLLVNWSAAQLDKFRFACHKSVIENPKLNLSDLIIATNKYHQLIFKYPTAELGEVHPPLQ